ncbi:hypothetical protein PVL29_006246 [Vitis rotundifolia]|uniref:Uncharacterized protein n=1 Tax=Vitis rotundifolia TaxID=103349 RepID=A0AA39A4R7_VITRO|nr:hypothetical protein PVL29_006246 [Vitis rotundifolia]
MNTGQGGLHWTCLMPLVPAVTELVIAELMYLQRMDPKEPVYKFHWNHS